MTLSHGGFLNSPRAFILVAPGLILLLEAQRVALKARIRESIWVRHNNLINLECCAVLLAISAIDDPHGSMIRAALRRFPFGWNLVGPTYHSKRETVSDLVAIFGAEL